MGTSFLPFSSLPSSGNDSKASSFIISRKELVVLCLIGILALGAGAGIAHATVGNPSESQQNEITLTTSDKPYRLPSVSKMAVFLREEARHHENIQAQISEYKENIREEASSQKSEVRVNGETIPVPQNGTMEKTITSENGTVEIHIESRNNQSNSNTDTSQRSRNSTSIDIDSRSNNSSQSYTKTEQRIRID